MLLSACDNRAWQHERHVDVIIPVNAIPKGYNWDDVGQDLLDWLLVNHTAAPQDGESSHVVPVAARSKNRPLALLSSRCAQCIFRAWVGAV